MCVSNAMLKKNETRFKEKRKSNENFNVKYVVVGCCCVKWVFECFLARLANETEI